ncbi:MAG TPA: hypothetical protein VN746_05515 [Gaiella sp.]|nr:hypothetical protein [Gaiella sp.]
MSTHCCERMDEALATECDDHPDRFDCPDALVGYWPTLREYGLIVHDGGTSMIVIAYCPWCGANLPSSLRDEWYDRLDQLGLDPDDPRVPETMRSDAWWRDPQLRARPQ